MLESLLDVLQSMPRSAIYAKLSPPGMESSVFAYTLGIQNYASMLKGLLGSGIIKWSGMITIGENCNFDELSQLIVLWKISIPILVGIPATFFVPNKLQTEQLINWKAETWCGTEHETDGVSTANDKNSAADMLPEPIVYLLWVFCV